MFNSSTGYGFRSQVWLQCASRIKFCLRHFTWMDLVVPSYFSKVFQRGRDKTNWLLIMARSYPGSTEELERPEGPVTLCDTKKTLHTEQNEAALIPKCLSNCHLRVSGSLSSTVLSGAQSKHNVETPVVSGA